MCSRFQRCDGAELSVLTERMVWWQGPIQSGFSAWEEGQGRQYQIPSIHLLHGLQTSVPIKFWFCTVCFFFIIPWDYNIITQCLPSLPSLQTLSYPPPFSLSISWPLFFCNCCYVHIWIYTYIPKHNLLGLYSISCRCVFTANCQSNCRNVESRKGLWPVAGWGGPEKGVDRKSELASIDLPPLVCSSREER